MDVRINGIKYVPAPPPPADKTLMSALEVRFSSDAGEDITIREYLCRLLIRVWIEREGFSGKRPFGDSGWEYDLFTPLVENGFLKGTLDEDGHVLTVDKKAAYTYVKDLISAAFYWRADK